MVIFLLYMVATGYLLVTYGTVVGVGFAVWFWLIMLINKYTGLEIRNA